VNSRWGSGISIAGSNAGHGSNPAHGHAKRTSAITQGAEVFALP
jgi:hypothetical protein